LGGGGVGVWRWICLEITSNFDGVIFNFQNLRRPIGFPPSKYNIRTANLKVSIVDVCHVPCYIDMDPMYVERETWMLNEDGLPLTLRVTIATCSTWTNSSCQTSEIERTICELRERMYDSNSCRHSTTNHVRFTRHDDYALRHSTFWIHHKNHKIRLKQVEDLSLERTQHEKVRLTL
jgi:hypothetical protein